MAEGAVLRGQASSGYNIRVGRPKRFSQPWKSIIKRIYIAEGTLLEFRELKNAKGIDSDDSALAYLLDYYRTQARSQVQGSFDSPISMHFIPYRAPGSAPVHSTPLSSRDLSDQNCFV